MASKSIPEFFSGRYVLVTGGTGFMGKVLLEKLLRSCPGIAGVYMLVRPKRGLDPEARLEKIIDTPLFEKVREVARRKVILVLADLKQKGLGISPASAEELKERVSVVFHSAATVRFNDPLKESVFLNARSTRDLVNLALEMPRLAVFLHVSTSYCNVDQTEIEERVYPPHADWRETIRILEEVDETALRVLTPKYIGGRRGLPNTYTFAKSLAEHIVKDHEDRIPAVIFRPSIVISTDSEPVPGWIDNLNGPVGLLLGAGMGVVHVTFADRDIIADYIPVDVAIKAMIVAAWKKGVETGEERRRVSVYNGASSSVKPITMGQMVDMGLALLPECPPGKVAWTPAGIITPNFPLYYMLFLITHVLPALVIDLGLRLVGVKFRLMKLQRKVFVANSALGYFTTHTWKIANDNVMNLDKEVPLKDRPAFKFAIVEREVEDFFRKAMVGSRRYLMKRPDEFIQEDKVHHGRILKVQLVVKFCFYTGLLYLVFTSSYATAFLDSLKNVFFGSF